MERFGDRTRFLLRGLLTKATPRGRWSSWGGWLWRLISPGNEQIQDHTATAHNGDRRDAGDWEGDCPEFCCSESRVVGNRPAAGRPTPRGVSARSAFVRGFGRPVRGC